LRGGGRPQEVAERVGVGRGGARQERRNNGGKSASQGGRAEMRGDKAAKGVGGCARRRWRRRNRASARTGARGRPSLPASLVRAGRASRIRSGFKRSNDLGIVVSKLASTEGHRAETTRLATLDNGSRRELFDIPLRLKRQKNALRPLISRSERNSARASRKRGPKSPDLGGPLPLAPHLR